jgi:hypothetical protein
LKAPESVTRPENPFPPFISTTIGHDGMPCGGRLSCLATEAKPDGTPRVGGNLREFIPAIHGDRPDGVAACLVIHHDFGEPGDIGCFH